jgi:transcriptional regulator of met regulon
MEKKNLLDLDLQLFGEEGEVADVEASEAVEPTEETTESEEVETGVEESGDAEPQPQSDEENARYAAIRRRAEDEARRRYANEMNAMNQQIAAMCQGVTHPITGQPITNMRDYVDALQIQQRQAQEQELQEKGIDPGLIDRMISQNPVVMQAKQVIEQTRVTEANNAIHNDLAEISKIDPNIRTINDLAALPNFPVMLDRVARGANLVDAYKMVNFDAFMQHTNDAARQQAINQMRGKSHLPSQSTGVSTGNDDVEVPAEIMSSWKEQGKTEKQIRELYKTVANKLHLN